MSRVLDEALAIVGDGENSVHVSFDMDGVDPQEAPGVRHAGARRDLLPRGAFAHGRRRGERPR